MTRHASWLAEQPETIPVPAPKLRHKQRLAGANGNTKLSEDAVADIRAMRAAGELLRVIAAKHGVSVVHVHHIVNGKRRTTGPALVDSSA